jgi:hypothetical protein
MAPTRAKARYAVTTLNLLTTGPKAIFKPPRFASLSATTHQANNGFHAKKVSLAVYPRHLGGAQWPATWLKTREIKALMSP